MNCGMPSSKYSHCGHPRNSKERESTERLFEDTISENFPNLARDMGNQIWGNPKDSKQHQTKEDYTETCYNQNVKGEGQGEIFESSKSKITHHIQENPHKAIIGLFNINFAGQERVQRYSQTAERKKLPTKNALTSKLLLQKCMVCYESRNQ